MALSGGNPVVSPVAGGRDIQAADEGNFYVAVNPTAATGIISGTGITAFTETTPYFVVYNGSATKSIYPVYLRLSETVVSAGGTQLNFTHTIDQGNRFSSGGTALSVANTNMGSATKSVATVVAGAVTASAASQNRRLLGNFRFRIGVIDVAGDQYEINYGGPLQPGSGLAMNGTVPSQYVKNVGPVVIGPNSSYVLVVWQPSSFTQGVTFEVEFGYIEK